MAYIYDYESNLLKGHSKISRELAQVMWHVTDECRLNCKFCFTKKMRHDASLNREKIDEIIALLRQLGVKKIDLSGGEPLLYKELSFLVSKCIENQINVTLTTSGLGLSENLEWLKLNWRKFSRIILSLDGTRELHNELRGTKDAFQSFVKYYKELKDVNCTSLRINTVVTKYLKDDCIAKELCSLICELSPVEWCLIEPYPINKSACFDDISVRENDFKEIVNKCKTILEKTEIKIVERTNSDFCSYWALYPDGYLYHSSNKKIYDTKLEVCQENIEKIKNNIEKYVQNYIIIDEGEMKMLDKEFIIENKSVDTISSNMLEQLSKQLDNRLDNIDNIITKKVSLKNKKCELNAMVTFVSSVAASVVASALWELIKTVYLKCKHPGEYRWELEITADKKYTVLVRTEDNNVKIDIKSE